MPKRVLIVPALLLLVLAACIKKVDRPSQLDPRDYYPLNTQDRYIYSGKIRSVVTSGQYGNLFTKTYLDSTGDLIMWEDLKATEDGVYLTSRTVSDDSIPEIHFEPPIPVAPWSRMVGDTLHFTTWEVRSDSINSHLRVELECEVIGFDTLDIPAGRFLNCIIVRMTYRTVDEETTPLLDGQSLYWYAENVGIVKYDTPDDKGILLQATVADRSYPQ